MSKDRLLGGTKKNKHTHTKKRERETEKEKKTKGNNLKNKQNNSKAYHRTQGANKVFCSLKEEQIGAC